MSKHDPQYSLLHHGPGEWSDGGEMDSEEEPMLEMEQLNRGDVEKKGKLPFPQPYRHHRNTRTTVAPLKVFLALLAVIASGILVAIIAGVVSSHWSAKPDHLHIEHPVINISPNPPTSMSSSVPKHSTPVPSNTVMTPPLTQTTTLSPLKSETSTPSETSTSTFVKIQPPSTNTETRPNWRVVLNNTGTESSIRTPDMDGDGLPDVLVGLAHGVDLAIVSSLDEKNSLVEYCSKKNLTYPCVGFLMALRGIDGSELWQLPTRSEVMFMMCDLDLNKDGIEDCVVTGRQSTIQAVDIRRGQTLWYADGTEYPSHFKQMWNVYQAVAFPDVDNDGVDDIVVAHGGDPNIEPKKHDRRAGRLIVLSGATGRPLGHYLEMPHNRETYMTPVMYTATDGAQYLLFGSGGETVSGDLMAITLPDLLRATKQNVTLDLKGDYSWTEHVYPLLGIMVLYSGDGKGVMVPPVIVDVDNDGVKDIMVSGFDGHMRLLDGKTLGTKWDVAFPARESYSTPAPGYYDDDEYLDFMVHWSLGAWPEYNDSKIQILSGKDGSILWEEKTSLYVMSSDLVLRSQKDHFDYFMVKMRGRNDSSRALIRTEAHGVGAQRNISRRDTNSDFSETCEHMTSEFKKSHVTCDEDLTNLAEQVYLVDRNNVYSSFPIHETLAQMYKYDYKPGPDETNCMPVDKETGIIHQCTPLLPESRSTDAMTDVDNDGKIDLINIAILEGRLRDGVYGYTGMKYTTIISRIDLLSTLQEKTGNPETGTVKENNFAPLETQPWFEYLGSATSSVYKKYNSVKHTL